MAKARPDDTTTYIHPDNTGGLRYERDVKASGTREHKYYVNSPAGLLGVQVVSTAGGGGSGGSSQMRYYHRDHQGSITAITNEAGSSIEKLAYEAFGERRNANGEMEDKTSPIIGISTDRGYTGHERLDELNLIHMNGRIYDPVIGRFMTPDPHIQSPDKLQSYNRYTYVLNNPLMYTDPSGYFSFGKIFAALFAPVTNGEVFRAAVTIAVAYYTGQWVGSFAGPVAGGAAGGFAGSFVGSGGDFRAGLQGAFTGGVFGAIGSATQGWELAEKVAAHAVGGCITASAGGGSCAQGALSAAARKAASGFLTEDGSWGKNNLNDFTRGVAVAVAGGLTAQIAGGKFANGAMTATYAYLFNHLSDQRGNPGDASSPESHPARGMSDTAGDTAGLAANGALLAGASLAAALGPGVAAAVYDSIGGMALVRYVGASGEAAVGWIGQKTAILNAAGKTFIADGVTFASVHEVKNVAALSLSPQIRVKWAPSSRPISVWV